MISWLGDYRDAGQFPINRGTEPKAIFIDEDGRLCAVAYLMTQSGYGDIADDIAATTNNALFRDLAASRADVAAWVKTTGLSIDDLATIQEPAYDPTGQWGDEDPRVVAVVAKDKANIQAKLDTKIKKLKKKKRKK